MRNAYFIVILLFGSLNTFAQIAYHDAIKLAGYIRQNDQKLVGIKVNFSIKKGDKTVPDDSTDNDHIEILRLYAPDAVKNNPDNDVVKDYYEQSNPFIAPYILAGGGAGIAERSKTPLSALRSLGSTISGVDVTTLTQATADFLIERVKDEVALEFFNRFRDDLQRAPELKHLFPRTYNLLLTIDDLRVPTLGQTWKSAFQEDLRNMLYNFEDLVNTLDEYKEIRQTQAFLVFIVAANGLDMHVKRFHPADILNRLDAKYGSDTEEIKQQIRLLNSLSRNLRRTDNELAWVKYDEFRKLTAVQMQLFIGLLYEQDKDLFKNIQLPLTAGAQSLTDFLTANNFANIKNFISYQQDLLLLLNGIDERIRTIKDLHANPAYNKSRIIEEYIGSLDLLINIVDYGISLKYFGEPDKFYETTYFKEYRPIAVYSADAIEAVHSKNYGLTVISTINALNPLLTLRLNKLERTASQTDATQQDVDRFVRFKRAKEKVSFYGSFMVDVINADSSEAIEAALNRYAQPVGSYRLKRRSNFSIDLNAFPGLYASSEWTELNTKNPKAGFAYGVTAPIGFAFSWGIHKKDKTLPIADNRVIGIEKKSGTFISKIFRGTSFSLYVPIVDIGAAVSYRISDDNGEGLPDKVKLGQIFSPGLYGILGIKNTPFSVMVGTQFTPLLRSINEANDLSGNAWRLGATLAVDIPVFNLFHREPVLTVKN